METNLGVVRLFSIVLRSASGWCPGNWISSITNTHVIFDLITQVLWETANVVFADRSKDCGTDTSRTLAKGLTLNNFSVSFVRICPSLSQVSFFFNNII